MFLYFMKRKVIQVGDSTQLLSLPRKWCKEYDIEKGQELNVDTNGPTVTITTDSAIKIETKDLDLNDLSPMILRCVVALYKKGVDEIRIHYDDPSLIAEIQKSIGKEAVGFEIVDQGSNFSVVKHVSGELDEFDPVLRRTFLLLINMANECLRALEKGDLNSMMSIAFLEEANNRFTTTCRRLLNKRGRSDKLVGPLYYIIEDLENLADQYKYLCHYLYEYKDKKVVIKKEVLSLFREVNDSIEDFYKLYYKFDKKLLAKLGKKRKKLVKETYKHFTTASTTPELIVLHHLIVIAQKVFCLIGPYLVLEL